MRAALSEVGLIGRPRPIAPELTRGGRPRLTLAWILAGLCVACPTSRRIDLEAERTALLALHEQILESHRTDDLDAWLAVEADTLVVGSRGELQRTTKAERAEGRREYLARTEFSVYRDLQEPIVQVAQDGSLAWLFARVEIVGTRATPEGTSPIQDVWTWVELYERRPEGWRLVGNVSTVKPQAANQ